MMTDQEIIEKVKKRYFINHYVRGMADWYIDQFLYKVLVRYTRWITKADERARFDTQIRGEIKRQARKRINLREYYTQKLADERAKTLRVIRQHLIYIAIDLLSRKPQLSLQTNPEKSAEMWERIEKGELL